SHGMSRQVEGPDVAGRKVAILEDTSTTGGSALTAVEGVPAAGGDVQAVAVIVDRDTGAAEHVAETAGVPYLYAFSKNDLRLLYASNNVRIFICGMLNQPPGWAATVCSAGTLV